MKYLFTAFITLLACLQLLSSPLNAEDRLYWAHYGDITSSNLDGTNPVNAHSTPGINDIAIDPKRRKLYFIDSSDTTIKRLSLDNHTEVDTIVAASYSNSLAIDPRNNRLYFGLYTDGIFFRDLDAGSPTSQLTSTFDKPVLAMVIDPIADYLYFSLKDLGIYRIDISEVQSPQKLVSFTDNSATDLALDLFNGILYWGTETSQQYLEYLDLNISRSYPVNSPEQVVSYSNNNSSDRNITGLVLSVNPNFENLVDFYISEGKEPEETAITTLSRSGAAFSFPATDLILLDNLYSYTSISADLGGKSCSHDCDGDYIIDCIDDTPFGQDLCPEDPDKTAPGQCGCATPDTDSDGDGIADCYDECPNDANKIEPGLCGCGTADTDSDGDGTEDCNDDCPYDPHKRAPGQCGCGVTDYDFDDDGTADCNDDCPADASKTSPGYCGCIVPDTDSDGDGTPDCADNCPNDSKKITPGFCGCGTADTDSDKDGSFDCADNCPDDFGKTDPGVCGCGVIDSDSDGDGLFDCKDECPSDATKTAPGVCGCNMADADSDNDGSLDCFDDCPNDPGKTQPGICGCGKADTDSDSDGTADCSDDCPLDPNKSKPGTNGCGNSDKNPLDSKDLCPDDPNKSEPGLCGCNVAETDTDADGFLDCIDLCPGHDDSIDLDNDLTPDGCDQCRENPLKTTRDKTDPDCGEFGTSQDSDLDGVNDDGDGCPFIPYKFEADENSDCGNLQNPSADEDNDGVPTIVDGCSNNPEKIDPPCGVYGSPQDSDQDGQPDYKDQCPYNSEQTLAGSCGCGCSSEDLNDNGIPDCFDPKIPSDRVLTPGSKLAAAYVRGKANSNKRTVWGQTFGSFSLEKIDSLMGLLGFAKRKIKNGNKERIFYEFTLRQIVELTSEQKLAAAKRNRSVKRKISKRNKATFKKLKPGSYQIRYRVHFKRGKQTVNTTNWSPGTRFSVAR